MSKKEKPLHIASSSIIETHCHLDYLDEDLLSETLSKSEQVNIEKILTIAVSPDNLTKVLNLSLKHPNVFASQGVHPHSAKDFSEDVAKTIQKNASGEKVLAIGEIGLDYHYNNSPKDDQLKAFQRQLDIAIELDMPVIIHSRDADEDMARILQSRSQKLKKKGVIHSFTSSKELAQTALDLGFYLGFNGIVTFNSAENVREVLKMTPLDKLLLETDSPYLTPVPFRGRKNHPYYLPFVLKYISEFLNVEETELAKQTSENAVRLFRF